MLRKPDHCPLARRTPAAGQGHQHVGHHHRPQERKSCDPEEQKVQVVPGLFNCVGEGVDLLEKEELAHKRRGSNGVGRQYNEDEDQRGI